LNTFQFTTEHNPWFILIGIAVAAIVSILLYRKDKKLTETKKWLITTLTIFRFICIFIICILLLNPLIKSGVRIKEKPIIIFAQDNSQSVALNKDSLYYTTEYPDKVKNMLKKLKNKFDVQSYSFGEIVKQDLTFNYSNVQTDYSNLFDEITNRFYNRNVGAIILATDGIYNKGINPLFTTSKMQCPVYTVALGDTNAQADIILEKANHNTISYLGNEFPLEIIIKAQNLKSASSKLSVIHNGKVLHNQPIDINNDNFIKTIELSFKSEASGLQKYTVALSNVDNEISTVNNKTDIYIDVLDGKQKILMLAYAPHPDITAIKTCIELNQNYTVDQYIIDDFDKSIEKYNLIILHQLPATAQTKPGLLDRIKNSDIPILYIIGSNTSIKKINKTDCGLTINNTNGTLNESQATYNDAFMSFKLSEQTLDFLPQFPPLHTPFGNYKSNLSGKTFINQKIGKVKTEMPLIMFSENTNKKSGIICGEGIWKWSITDYKINSNRDVFNELINKTIQYLSIKVDKSFFRIKHENIFLENEAVIIDAELYNDNYELINDPELNIEILNKQNKKFNYTFNRTTNAYRLNAGQFPVGTFTYKCTVKVGDKIFSKTGEFNIRAIQSEYLNTVADHQLLNQLALNTGGRSYTPQNIDDLLQNIENRNDLKTISYYKENLKALINLKWLFFVIIGFITIEWFVRKYSGTY